MSSRWFASIVVALILVLPPLLLWPLPLVAQSALLSVPWSEGGSHIWGYWAAQQAGSIHTDAQLLRYPLGQSMNLVDPLHLIPYALGDALGGPALGFNFVLCFGLMVSGVAGWMLARVTGADASAQILGACIGLSCPGLLAIGVDGITEGLGAGWVGIQLAVLLRLLRCPSALGVLSLALTGAACAWSGAYNAVWMALVDTPILLWAWFQKKERAKGVKWSLLGVLSALLLSIPYLIGAAQVGGDAPGSQARSAPVPPDPHLPWRGSWREGADVLDLFCPGWLTSDVASAPTTAYLGVVLIFATVLGFRRWEGARPWVWGTMAMVLLTLGPFWVIQGRVFEIGGWAPSTLASAFEQVPVIERISRWYRAGVVAILLMIPVAVRAFPGRRALWLAPVILLDARLGAPIPVQWSHTSLPSLDGVENIVGPVAEIPRVHPMFPPEHPAYLAERVADWNLLVQIRHGQPSSGTQNQAPLPSDVNGALVTLEREVVSPQPNPQLIRSAQGQLYAQGYRNLLIYPRVLQRPPTQLESILGPPHQKGEHWWLYALSEP